MTEKIPGYEEGTVSSYENMARGGIPPTTGAAPKTTALDLPGWVQNSLGEIYYYGKPQAPGAYESALSVWEADRLRQQQNLKQTPNAPSSSYNVSQSFADPASLDLQRQQMEQELYAINLRDAADRAQLDFARDKFSIETQAGQRSEARQTQALMEQIQARQVQNQFDRVQLQYSIARQQAEMDFAAAQANAQMQMQAQQINESRRQANLEQQRGVANDIAQFVGDPSSVGKNAAYYLAGSSQGNTGISRAMAEGQVGYDTESLRPLDLLLQNRDELAKGPTLFQAPSVSAPRLQTPDLSFLNAQAPTSPAMNPAAAGQASSTPTVYVSGTGLPTPAAGTQGTGFQPAGIDPATGNLRFTAMAQGGYTNARMFKGDEKGPELYVNPTGAPIMVVPNHMAEQVPGFAEGTVDYFSQYAPGNVNLNKQDYNPTSDPTWGTSLYQGDAPGGRVETRDQYQSRLSSVAAQNGYTIAGYVDGQPQYRPVLGQVGMSQAPAPEQPKRLTPEELLKQAYDKVFAASPWAGMGASPTAVGLSGPGTSPYIRQYGAALAALRGFNPYLYQSEAQAATPAGISGVATRRSR